MADEPVVNTPEPEVTPPQETVPATPAPPQPATTLEGLQKLIEVSIENALNKRAVFEVDRKDIFPHGSKVAEPMPESVPFSWQKAESKEPTRDDAFAAWLVAALAPTGAYELSRRNVEAYCERKGFDKRLVDYTMRALVQGTDTAGGYRKVA